MKYGLSYILLDGEELLEDNVINMRSHFDFISVVLTEKSPTSKEVPSKRCLSILDNLLNRGLINKVIKVNSKNIINENLFALLVRNTSLQSLKDANCNIGCVSDVDEFYESAGILNCKKILETENVDIIFTKLKHYYADEIYAFEKVGEYNETNCPFLFKIKKDLKFGNPIIKYPYADPKRYFTSKLNFRLVDPSICYVHHFWMVRTDLEKKFKIRSAMMGKAADFFKESINNWKNWKPGLPGMGFGFKKHELYKQTHSIKLENFYKYAKRR